MQVRVYRSEHRNQWAVVKVGKGNRKVTFYADALTLTNATFHAGPKSGHICKSGHKNRHNYIEGTFKSFAPVPYEPLVWPCDSHVRLAHKRAAWQQRTCKTNEMIDVAAGKRVEFTSYGAAYTYCPCGDEDYDA